MTARYSRCVTSNLPIQKPWLMVTSVCGPSSAARPVSFVGLPSRNLFGGINKKIVCGWQLHKGQARPSVGLGQVRAGLNHINAPHRSCDIHSCEQPETEAGWSLGQCASGAEEGYSS